MQAKINIFRHAKVGLKMNKQDSSLSKEFLRAYLHEPVKQDGLICGLKSVTCSYGATSVCLPPR